MILCKLGLHSYGPSRITSGGGSGNSISYANYSATCKHCGKINSWTNHWKPSNDVIAISIKESQKETPNALG